MLIQLLRRADRPSRNDEAPSTTPSPKDVIKLLMQPKQGMGELLALQVAEVHKYFAQWQCLALPSQFRLASQPPLELSTRNQTLPDHVVTNASEWRIGGCGYALNMCAQRCLKLVRPHQLEVDQNVAEPHRLLLTRSAFLDNQ